VPYSPHDFDFYLRLGVLDTTLHDKVSQQLLPPIELTATNLAERGVKHP